MPMIIKMFNSDHVVKVSDLIIDRIGDPSEVKNGRVLWDCGCTYQIDRRKKLTIYTPCANHKHIGSNPVSMVIHKRRKSLMEDQQLSIIH